MQHSIKILKYILKHQPVKNVSQTNYQTNADQVKN